jgi:hypothetical protein
VLRSLLRFPDPVNELAARVVAAGVVTLTLTTLASQEGWLLVPLAAGFWARVASGPRFSPLGQLATRVVAPRLGPPKLVPGRPKRFAQGIGVLCSTTAAVLWLGAGDRLAATVVLIALLGAAGMEAFLGLCLGCRLFGLVGRLGFLPAAACPECADLSRRWTEREGTAQA